MWNTMECKRDSSNGSLGGASETHWECVSHCFKTKNRFFKVWMDTIDISGKYFVLSELTILDNFFTVFYVFFFNFWSKPNYDTYFRINFITYEELIFWRTNCASINIWIMSIPQILRKRRSWLRILKSKLVRACVRANLAFGILVIRFYF